MLAANKFITAGTLVVASASASATEIYTEPSSFLAALLPGSYLETFDRPGKLSIDAPSFSFSSSDYSYTITAGGSDGTPSLVYRDVAAIVARSLGGTLNITFTSGNVTAIGGDFFSANLDGWSGLLDIRSHSVTAELSDGTSITYTPTNQASSFRGFTSSVPITNLLITSNVVPSSTTPVWWSTMDNLRVGVASPIPEPSTWLMMGLGLLAISSICAKKSDSVQGKNLAKFAAS